MIQSYLDSSLYFNVIHLSKPPQQNGKRLSFTRQPFFAFFLGLAQNRKGGKLDRHITRQAHKTSEHRRIMISRSHHFNGKRITLRWISHFLYYSCMVHELQPKSRAHFSPNSICEMLRELLNRAGKRGMIKEVL